MNARILPWLAIGLLLAAAPAYAQMGGGGTGGGGGHHGGGGKGGGGKTAPSTTAKAKAKTTTASTGDKPTDQIEITGVVAELDPAHSRITIDYDAVDELNWPKGTMPFPVAKDEMLQGLKVGQKVQFRVEEHEIAEIHPFVAPKPAAN